MNSPAVVERFSGQPPKKRQREAEAKDGNLESSLKDGSDFVLVKVRPF